MPAEVAFVSVGWLDRSTFVRRHAGDAVRLGAQKSMLIAVRQLLLDFLSAAFFYLVIALGGSTTLALELGISIGVIQIAVQRSRGQPIPAIQLMGLALVVVLGGSSILLNDARLVMLKPTISRAALGVIMLRRGWLGRYLPPIAQCALSPDVIDRTGYVWAALMFALALVNLVVAATCSLQTWAAYASVGPTIVKAIAIAVTYVTLRALVNRKLGPAPTS
jgi:intracellular septation protein A